MPLCRWSWEYGDPATVNLTLTLSGGRTTNAEVLYIPPTATLSEVSTTLAPTAATGAVGWHVVDMIALVHKEGDVTAGKGGEGSGAGKVRGVDWGAVAAVVATGLAVGLWM